MTVDSNQNDEDQNEHEKRLSYGGVGLLFDANVEIKAAENEMQSNNVFNPNNDSNNFLQTSSPNPLSVSFKPTYEGIATLFDDNHVLSSTNSDFNDIVHKTIAHHNKKNMSFAGDIVELFTDPNNRFVQQHLEQMQQYKDGEQVEEEEEEEQDPMDEQRQYNYSDDDEEEEEDNKNQAQQVRIYHPIPNCFQFLFPFFYIIISNFHLF